jgi:tetratricopeptide (TPR) repeat protein
MMMPVPVKAVFRDGSEQTKQTDRNLDTSILAFTSKARLKEAVINPENKLAMLDKPLSEISEEAAEMLSLGWSYEDSPDIHEKLKEENITNSNILYRLGMGLYEYEHYLEAFNCFQKISALQLDKATKFASFAWQGLLKDLLGDRKEALKYYQEALVHDTGESMGHSSLGINMNRQWVEERLKTPFSRKKK